MAFETESISIHAARVGCDQWLLVHSGSRNLDFNPRSPSGLRPFRIFVAVSPNLFQSTQPEWAATLLSYCYTHSLI